ncbi:MAG: S46 family peptidase, partial [Candidatus Omnitrophota bacterium]
EKRLSGDMILARPIYYKALEAFHQGVLASDANGTIRISYGTVRGYRPAPGREEYFPFTKVWQVGEKWAKYKGEFPFELPANILEALRERRFGPYVDKEIGEVPVNFLTDLDITNGNSGSATLNAKGEFAGIAFDGNIEGVASDLVFMEEVTRAIHVDVRYIKWVLDAVEHAGNILEEMGVKPAFCGEK